VVVGLQQQSDMVAVFHLVHRANWIAVGLDQGLWIGYLDDSNGTQPSGTAGDPGVPIGHFTPWTSGATVGPDNCARLVFEPAQASNPINLFTTECQPPAGVSFFGLGQMREHPPTPPLPLSLRQHNNPLPLPVYSGP
jgi:hypothetical protein